MIRTGPDSLSFASLPAFEAVYGYNKHIEKGDSYNFARDATNQAGSIFTARTDVQHKECKRKVAPALTPSKIASYRPILSKNVSILIQRISDTLKARQSPNLNVVELVKRYTFDTAVEVIFGDSLSTEPWTDLVESQGIISTFETMLKMSGGIPLLPSLAKIMYLPSVKGIFRRPKFTKNGTMIGVGALALRSRKVVFDEPDIALKSSNPSMLKNFLALPKDDTRKMKSDETWRECFNMLFAGQSSTSAALIAVLCELSQPYGQEWQHQIRISLNNDKSDPITLPILTAVLKETMRLHTPFSTAFPRVITPGAENAIPDLPTPIPVGTTISSNTYILGRAEELWGEDVNEWKPQRWMGVNDTTRRRLEDHYVVFGKGPRGCVGKDIAMLMLAEAVIAVLLKWNLVSRSELKGGNFLEMQYDLCEIEFKEVGKE